MVFFESRWPPLFSILAAPPQHSISVFLTILIIPRIHSSASLISRVLGIVQSAAIRIGRTVAIIFYSLNFLMV